MGENKEKQWFVVIGWPVDEDGYIDKVLCEGNEVIVRVIYTSTVGKASVAFSSEFPHGSRIQTIVRCGSAEPDTFSVLYGADEGGDKIFYGSPDVMGSILQQCKDDGRILPGIPKSVGHRHIGRLKERT